jgi:hypothetical protein
MAEVQGVGSAPQVATDIEVADAGPWLGDSTGNLLHELVVRGASAGIARTAAPGYVAPAPGFTSTMSPGVSELYLPVFPGSLPLPIDWRWVEGEVESACSQVTRAERLLHETLASVH